MAKKNICMYELSVSCLLFLFFWTCHCDANRKQSKERESDTTLCILGHNMNTWDQKEKRAFGELWDNTVSHAALSVKVMVAHLGDHLECQCNVMHLVPLSSDWRLLFDRVGYPRREPTKSFHHLAGVTACDHCSCQ